MPKYINAEDFKAKYLCCGYLPEMSEEEFDAFPGSDFEADERPHCGAEVKTSDLKPCPFCGGAFIVTNPLISRLEVKEAWNRRCENEN